MAELDDTVVVIVNQPTTVGVLLGLPGMRGLTGATGETGMRGLTGATGETGIVVGLETSINIATRTIQTQKIIAGIVLRGQLA